MRQRKVQKVGGITVLEVLEDTSKGSIKISKHSLFAGPLRNQKDVDFWEERLDHLGTPYLLAEVEMAEKNDDEETMTVKGQAIFVSDNGAS